MIKNPHFQGSLETAHRATGGESWELGRIFIGFRESEKVQESYQTKNKDCQKEGRMVILLKR